MHPFHTWFIARLFKLFIQSFDRLIFRVHRSFLAFKVPCKPGLQRRRAARTTKQGPSTWHGSDGKNSNGFQLQEKLETLLDTTIMSFELQFWSMLNSNACLPICIILRKSPRQHERKFTGHEMQLQMASTWEVAQWSAMWVSVNACAIMQVRKLWTPVLSLSKGNASWKHLFSIAASRWPCLPLKLLQLPTPLQLSLCSCTTHIFLREPLAALPLPPFHWIALQKMPPNHLHHLCIKPLSCSAHSQAVPSCLSQPHSMPASLPSTVASAWAFAWIMHILWPILRQLRPPWTLAPVKICGMAYKHVDLSAHDSKINDHAVWSKV